MTVRSRAGESAQGITVSAAAIAWIALGALLLVPRLAAVWQLPVGGSEWLHLSGAWNATLGVDDDRFVPSLFQALSALLLSIDASETLPRLLAFIATATVPVALYMLRPQLGEAGALLALLLLALDAPAAWLGVAASASAFDVAIALWFFVLLVRPGAPWWLWPIAAFGVATAGPVPLALAIAAGGLALFRGRRPDPQLTAAVIGAAMLGIVLASFGFGYGWQGVAVPPLVLFAEPFEQHWTTGTVADVLLLYSWPLVFGGVVAAVLSALRWDQAGSHPGAPLAWERLLVAWFAVAVAWMLVASNTRAEAPLVAATLPAALLAGLWLARAFDAMFAVRWHQAWLLLGVAFFVFALAAIVVVDWARWDRVGEGGEVARVAILGVATIAILAFLAFYRPARPVLIVPVVALGAVPLISGAFNVGFGAYAEPFPSPQSPVNARVLSAVVLDVLEETPGPVVVHESLRDEVTWPFRETTPLIIATRVPPDAAVAILPAGADQPQGMAPIDGDWALVHHVEQPTTGILRYVRWLTDRKHTDVHPEPVQVFVRDSE